MLAPLTDSRTITDLLLSPDSEDAVPTEDRRDAFVKPNSLDRDLRAVERRGARVSEAGSRPVYRIAQDDSDDDETRFVTRTILWMLGPLIALVILLFILLYFQPDLFMIDISP